MKIEIKNKGVNMSGTDIISEAEQLGRALAEAKVSKSQLRKFLSAVNSISNKLEVQNEYTEDIASETQYLRVKLAYQAGRYDKLKHFAANLNNKIKVISSKKDYENFAKYVEAIIAYHKFNGGSD